MQTTREGERWLGVFETAEEAAAANEESPRALGPTPVSVALLRKTRCSTNEAVQETKQILRAAAVAMDAHSGVHRTSRLKRELQQATAELQQATAELRAVDAEMRNKIHRISAVLAVRDPQEVGAATCSALPVASNLAHPTNSSEASSTSNYDS
jgi:hypothetical protein